jgi:hypothetical protein
MTPDELDIRSRIAMDNWGYWIRSIAMESKYCKLHGFVSIYFDCSGCTLCENKSHSLGENLDK